MLVDLHPTFIETHVKFVTLNKIIIAYHSLIMPKDR